MVESNIKYMIVGTNSQYIIRAVIVAVTFTVITMIASIEVLKRKDIWEKLINTFV